jgi:hypothetical protein
MSAHFSPKWRASRKALVGLSLAAGVALTLVTQSLAPLSGAASAADQGAVAPTKSFNIAELTTMKLDALPDIDWITVESGSLHNAETVFYEGENTVLVWEAGPAKLVFEEPSTYDEFVLVLKGTLILTDTAGNASTYGVGDTFTLPKGFVGTWDMTELFRELVIINTEAYNAGS